MLVLRKQKTKNWGTDANLKLIVATSRIASAKNGLNGQEVMLIQDQRFQKWAFWCYLQWFWKCCFDDQRKLPRKMPNSVNFVFFKKCVPNFKIYTSSPPFYVSQIKNVIIMLIFYILFSRRTEEKAKYNHNDVTINVLQMN